MAPIHDRMPVILQPDNFDKWLDPYNNIADSLAAMLGPCPPESMRAYPVSPAINRGTVHGKECITPLGE